MVEIDSFRVEHRCSGYCSFDEIVSFRAEIRGGLIINLMMKLAWIGLSWTIGLSWAELRWSGPGLSWAGLDRAKLACDGLD